ncbi:zinc finger protein 608-like isoform X1 [Limulus polyphemus]|uniref:Zinc finger protein 608-like isoform X1 n=1 Tax=Limulus polyphemus TaxID=6850 RepID=A0ABM1TBH2_LIMPO|nr:zinc finger protein 608-like isoform X1 [Limulus polyphemus]XP_022253228.1 zinc finger protein 608-like isoform X1 [Limulus polyphemus]XP_022253241.1 zinc finger protein 608-like isoform X1 [Limulus polyphemus]XP_022253247.1 zinc finger protein 608-like isoform X1 [Limulus polyphemus]
MKDQPLDGQRGKVAVLHSTKPICLESVKSELKNSVTGSTNATNFDDDYNEWELGIGELIIDLDADIEKNNDKNGQHSQANGSTVINSPAGGAVSLNLLSTQETACGGMSSSKISRMSSGGSNAGSSSNTCGGIANLGAPVEHQATVDKGLKMKIKRKNVGSKFSEAKHEIVQSDTKTSSGTEGSSSNGVAGISSAEAKPKHSSSKGRSSSHREKKDKNRDKDKNRSTELNGISGNISLSTPSLKVSAGGLSLSSLPTPTVNLGLPAGLMVPKNVTSNSSSNTVLHDHVISTTIVTTGTCASLANYSPKVDTRFTSSSATLKQDDTAISPPQKKIKVEKQEEVYVDGILCARGTKDSSTCTSVGTLTEPECLGPCEPGTSVMLEGIVWQETDGGVLVVNVTWRGKTYVGTLLDCTKHDWAPPRFCDSPTSDIDAKSAKGRGKRGRGSSNSSSEVNFSETRTVQSKLRSGKGRRNVVSSNNTSNSTSGFTVPSSPAKSDSGACGIGKRKGRTTDTEVHPSPNEVKTAKRSRSQLHSTPIQTTISTHSAELPQPNSPALIECPEPNCKKKYKHINGLRYHQSHAHSSSDSGKVDEGSTEETKDVTNSSDNDESMQEPSSVPPSPAPSTRSSASPSPLFTRTGQQSEHSVASSGIENEDMSSDKPSISILAIGEQPVSCKSSPVIQFASSPGLSTSTVQTQKLVPSESVDELNVSLKPLISCAPVSSSSTVAPELQSAVSLSISNASSQGLNTTTVSNLPSNTLINAITTTSIPSVTVSIPTSHFFSFGQSQNQHNILATTTAVMSSGIPTSLSTIRQVPSTSTLNTVTSTSLPSAGIPVSLTLEKNRTKQDKVDKSKLKTSSSPTIRPIVPAPAGPMITIATSIPTTHHTYGHSGHSLVTSSLKPIQPKPTILGEPSTINPVLESLKKEKTKHKKKSKDKDKKMSSTGNPDRKPGEGPKTPLVHPFQVDPLQNINLNPINRTCKNHQELSLTGTTMKNTTEPHLEKNSIDPNNISENVQSPAYSDISDDNETAPILESEMQDVKDKEDKTMELASQSTPTNLSPYGMYSYYSPPPYLIPSAPPSVTASALGPEKLDTGKKSECDKHNESKTWPGKSLDSNQDRIVCQDTSEQKVVREEQQNNPLHTPTGGSSSNGPLQQGYPYPYGYIQGYPCGLDPAYHMHLLASDPHYKKQYERYIKDQERLLKEHSERQQYQHFSKDNRSVEIKDRCMYNEKVSPIQLTVTASGASDLTVNKLASPSSSARSHKEREKDCRISSGSTRVETSLPPTVLTSLKEKQIENHQILKENIELKTHMDSKAKLNQLEAVRLYKRELELQRYNMLHSHYMEQQKSESDQQASSHVLHQKEEHSSPVSHSASRKPSPVTDISRTSSVIASPRSDPNKPVIGSISSSPKPRTRDIMSPHNKDHSSTTSGGIITGNNKKDSVSSTSGKHRDSPETSQREDKIKSEKKISSEGQKPTMETTGPPPPPTNTYAYLHPSYLQPPHFGHMPFEGHPMYRASLNPMLMSSGTPYGGSPYLHPQLRYHVPHGPCDIPPHSQAPTDALGPKMSSPNAPKALDLLHQVSQHYSSHKIHELQERAIMSPAPISTPATTVASAMPNKSSDTSTTSSKQETSTSEERSRLLPPQRHLHTHHHTHVGVGYPLYDPYGVAQPQWKQAQRQVPFKLTQ